MTDLIYELSSAAISFKMANCCSDARQSRNAIFLDNIFDFYHFICFFKHLGEIEWL